MLSKCEKRIRRARKVRANIKNSSMEFRLSVHRTSQHIYAQIVQFGKSDVVLAAASTLEKSVRELTNNLGSNISAATVVGKLIAERALKLGISNKVAFDRSGYKYHGRVKALADAARANGLII